MRGTGKRHGTFLGYLTIAAALLVGGAGCVSGAKDGRSICHPVVRQYDPAIEPYVSFLQTQSTGPVDYIMGLFKKYDIVILCERWHMEMTQYDMIYQLISDPRFIEEVGVIFTETGTVALQSDLDEFMEAHDLSPEEVARRAVHIMRNASSYWPFWEKRNFYDLLVKLHALNRELSKDSKRIRWYFTDIPCSWEGGTKEGCVATRWLMFRRDLIEAECVIKERRRRLAAGEPSKCLVIMNYRHAFGQHIRHKNGRGVKNTAAYIFEAFPGETANVLINTAIVTSAHMDLIHEGRWDAAFEALGNPDVGFDLDGSPFGTDSFDLYRVDLAPETAALPYQDMFTGFVFYKPLRGFHMVFGAPGLIDESFLETVRQRCELTEGTLFPVHFASVEPQLKAIMEQGEVVWTADNLVPDYQQKIDRWLVDDESHQEGH